MATFTLEKQSCHNWKLYNDDVVTVVSVRLYTYLDVLLDDELAFTNDELTINLEDYEGGDDGAYYIEIRHGSTKIIRSTVCFYDLCSAENCYKSLFKFVLCKVRRRGGRSRGRRRGFSARRRRRGVGPIRIGYRM